MWELQTFIDNNFLWIMLSVSAVFTMIWLLLLRERLRMAWYMAIPIAVLHVIYGVFCVRVFARLEGAGNGAMSLFGAVFFMPVAYYLGARLSKRSVAEVFDIFTVPLVFTLMLARVNCLHAGCCLGQFITGTQMRWPTRQAEVLFYIVFLAVMIPKVRKKKTYGNVYPIYMTAYGGFRFIIEFFREVATDTLFHLSHMWAITAIVLGVSVYIKQRNKTIKRELSDKKRRK